MTQEELTNTIAQLISLGGNSDELELWQALYPTLSEEKKLALDKNFLEELGQLQRQN